MVLANLTPEEQARHEKGIDKIRRRLFRRYQPSDYFIIPNSELVIAASAENCWNAACGSYRVLRFGGLSYVVDCLDQAGLCRFSTSHVDADLFQFWLTAAKHHTVCSITVRFRELDEEVYARVASYRRANSSPEYPGRTRKPA